MDKYKVLLPQPIAQEGLDLLINSGYEIVIPDRYDIKTLKEKVVHCDAILVRTAIINDEIIESGKKLKVIARHGIGLDNVDIEKATEKGVFVCNAPLANANSVAEHVVGMMISLAHQTVKADKALRKGNFEVRNTYIGTELKEKVLGLIGFGNIGQLVAQKCALGLGMQVLAYDPAVKNSPDYVKLTDSMDTVLEESDFISLHIPYNQHTHRLIDASQLSKMKSSAYLINAARGGIVDENDLYNAIKNNIIAGAGLDCFEEEPPRVDHPLWELDNVIVTPHMAAHSKEALVAMAVTPAQIIIDVLSGNKPENCVNYKQINSSRVVS